MLKSFDCFKFAWLTAWNSVPQVLIYRHVSSWQKYYPSTHIILTNVILKVLRELLIVHKVRQPRPKLGILYTARLQFEPKVRIHRDEKAV